MRKYTKELLVGFKKLSDKPEARIAKARKALGIAIIYEADIGTENLRKTVKSPWMGHVGAAFEEMKDEEWIEQIPAPGDYEDYSEFKNAILKSYGEYTTRPKEILERRYTFGDHWFYLTSWGEEKANTLFGEGSKLKAFLSYSTLDKELAGQIKSALEDYGIEVFLAHEDIEPSAEWVETIKAELKASHIFLPILTDDFHKSNWTDQETGIAFNSNKLIIPFKITTDPYGFISKFQALPIKMNVIQSSCRKLVQIIASKPGTGDLLKDTLIRKFGESNSYEDANHNTDLLLSFQNYALTQVINILRHTIANSQIHKAFVAQKRLPNLINQYRDDIDSRLLQEFNKAIR